MSKISKIIVLVLSAVLVFGVIFVLSSCNNGGDGTETTENGTGTGDESDGETTGELPPEVEDKMTIEGKTALIEGEDMSIKLQAGGNSLTVVSLTAKGGENVMGDDSEFALPQSVKVDGKVMDVVWTFKKVEKRTETEDDHVVSTANFIYESEKYGLILNVAVGHRPGISGPFQFVTSISNSNGQSVRINPGEFASFGFEFVKGEKLWYFSKESGYAEGFTSYQGIHFGGMGTYSQEIKSSTSKIIYATVYQDSNQSGFIPMMYVTNGKAGKYVALEWTSGMMTLKANGTTTRISIDMDEISKDGGPFSTLIPAGDTFWFPTVYVGAFEGDVDDGANEFKSFFFRCRVPDELRENPNEPYTQMDMQSGINTYGIEMIKWDYGWWSNTKTGDWSSHEGSWELRSDAYKGVLSSLNCKDMNRFGRVLEKADIKFALYVLLHDTQIDANTVTDEFGEFNSITHPEWFSNRRIAPGMGRSADLGNAECVEYLKTAMKEMFTEYGVTGWRSDFGPICYYSDKQNRHDANGTDVQYWATVGYRDLTTYLCEEIPGFRYENCSSGGSIKDLLTASVATIIQCDDSSNYLSARMAFYDASFVIPPVQLEMICNWDFANPDKSTFWPKAEQGDMTKPAFRNAMIDMGFRSQVIGNFCFSSWTGNVSATKYKEYSDMYENKLRDMIKHGQLWHVLPRPDGENWDGIQYSYKDSENSNGIKGALFVFKPSPKAGNSVDIKLRGLYPDRTYVLTSEDHSENDITATGEELMNGITVTITDSVGSDIIWITEK